MRSLLAFLLACVAVQPTPAQSVVSGPCTFRFASEAESRAVLGAEDEFTNQLTSFDVQSRLHSIDATEPQAYRKAAAASVLPWTAADKDRVLSATTELATKIRRFNLPMPEEILLVYCSGEFEGDAPHTRNNAIILTRKRLSGNADLQRLLAHELFHILSRKNPQWRDQLYALIGYQRCPPITLPEPFEKRRVTNPDAPIVQHFIEVEIGSTAKPVAQVLISKVAEYPADDPRPFFSYVDLQFVELHQVGNQMQPRVDAVSGQLITHDLLNNDDFLDQVGRNTRYLIHPEEILADNFSLLVTEQEVVTKAILQRLRSQLQLSE